MMLIGGAVKFLDNSESIIIKQFNEIKDEKLTFFHFYRITLVLEG